MKSSKIKTKIEIAVMIAATAVLAAGCCTKKQTASNTPPPIESGAPPVPVETETANANNMVIPLEKEQLQVGTQQVPNGSVRIHKTVKTETVTQPVTVRTETVSIERVPPGSAPPAGTPSSDISKPFQEGDVVIPLTKEQPVVSTQIVPNGAVVVNKQQSTSTVNVQGQVRSEDVTTAPGSSVQIAPSTAAGAPAPGYNQSGGAGGNISSPDQLTSASDPSAMAGQQVSFPNVPVQKVVGPHLIAIGSASGSPLYVHTADPVSGISPGQMVSVSGTVQQAPATPQGWDAQSAQALQGQRIFIDAKSITPATQ